MMPAVVRGLLGRRILIVEDELLVAMELELLLERQGCVALGPVPSVQRTLALLAEERPDLALLDVDLGGRRVTPVAAELRARGVPFVLVTGCGRLWLEEPELQRAPRVPKPVNHRQLVRLMAQVLEAGQPGSGS